MHDVFVVGGARVGQGRPPGRGLTLRHADRLRIL